MAKSREGSEEIMKDYEQRKQALNEANVKSAAKMAASKPTPTQEECDMIKLGVLDLDGKEDDGSGPELVRVTELREVDRSAEASGGAAYEQPVRKSDEEREAERQQAERTASAERRRR